MRETILFLQKFCKYNKSPAEETGLLREFNALTTVEHVEHDVDLVFYVPFYEHLA